MIKDNFLRKHFVKGDTLREVSKGLIIAFQAGVVKTILINLSF